MGNSSTSASVVPYVIMAILSVSCSVIFYYLIFPCMLNLCSDGVVFACSAIYFGGIAVLFYYVIEPALINAFKKNGRFISHRDAEGMTMIMNAAFFTVLGVTYFVVMRSYLNQKKAGKKNDPTGEATSEQTEKLVNLIEELKAKKIL